MLELLMKLSAEMDSKESKNPFAKKDKSDPKNNSNEKKELDNGNVESVKDSGENSTDKKEEPIEEQNQTTPQEAPVEEQALPNQTTKTQPIGIVGIMDFMQQYPNGSAGGVDINSLAAKAGISQDEFTQSVYALAMKTARLFRGGYMNDVGINMATIDQNELALGTKREMSRHGIDESIAKKMALDNLSEVPDYYSREKAMIEDSVAENNAAAIPIDPARGPSPEEPVDESKPNDAPWNTPSVEYS